MKKIISYLFFIGIVIFIISFAVPQIEKDYTGKWTFEAPDAPEGSKKGTIEITPTSIIMTFDDMVGFPSNWARMRNDSIIYETTFDLATVLFSLKIIDGENLQGKAVWEDGESAMIMKKAIIGVRL